MSNASDPAVAAFCRGAHARTARMMEKAFGADTKPEAREIARILLLVGYIYGQRDCADGMVHAARAWRPEWERDADVLDCYMVAARGVANAGVEEVMGSLAAMLADEPDAAAKSQAAEIINLLKGERP